MEINNQSNRTIGFYTREDKLKYLRKAFVWYINMFDSTMLLWL